MAGLVVASTVPLLTPSPGERLALLTLSLTMFALVLASTLLPWRRWSPWALLFFPYSAMAGGAALGYIDGRFGASYVGLHTLCFIWAGLYGRPLASLALLPVAVPTWLVALDGWSPITGVRMLISVLLWLVVAEVLAALTRRNDRVVALLERAARTDSLTTVGNRAGLRERLSSVPDGDAVVMLDLDHFKAINDELGHAVGDRILSDFGATLRTCVRAEDFVARYGGEEFVIILSGASATEPAVVTARIRRQWELLHPLVTFSAGIARHRADRRVDASLDAADRALYQAKEAGRDQDRFERSPEIAGEPSSRALLRA
ncbi:GGDEF domain-containing protein [Geodermatophilus sp. SYSU D00965]